jgi:hypothetical protein
MVDCPMADQDDQQQPCPSGECDIDSGYASDSDPSTNSVGFSTGRQAARNFKRDVQQRTPQAKANAETSGGNVKMPTGNRRIADGPPKQLQVPISVDADTPTARKFIPRRSK